MTTKDKTWRNALWLAVLAFGPLCMGNDGCDDQFVGTQSVCEYGGKTYAAGDDFSSLDGCNTCRCEEGGGVACTERACLDAGPVRGCLYEGEQHQVGESFPAADGCNSCACETSGAVVCTAKACLDMCTYGGKTYAVGERFPSSDGCNTCTCGSEGSVACTERACADGGMASGCSHGGKNYKTGESFPAGDGCNSCACEAGGSVACTAAFCSGTCTYAGKTYQEGERFKATDGCNSCSCASDGAVGCTEVACACGTTGPIPAPSVWSQFRVVQTWGPCGPGKPCKNQWTVSPDRQIAVQRSDAFEQTNMDAADFCALVSILGDPSFVASMRQGFTCEEPPTDVFFNLELDLESETLKQSVTGCVTTGPNDNLAGAAVDIVNDY